MSTTFDQQDMQELSVGRQYVKVKSVVKMQAHRPSACLSELRCSRSTRNDVVGRIEN